MTQTIVLTEEVYYKLRDYKEKMCVKEKEIYSFSEAVGELLKGVKNE